MRYGEVWARQEFRIPDHVLSRVGPRWLSDYCLRSHLQNSYKRPEMCEPKEPF